MTLIDLIILGITVLVLWLGHWPLYPVLLTGIVAIIIVRILRGERAP